MFFKVDNWADNEALRSTHKPIYRRSFSELPTTPNNHVTNINRRSLEGNLLSANFPKSSTSMTDILHSQNSEKFHVSPAIGKTFSRSVSDKDTGPSSTLYTYIGISEPDKEKHFYENHSIIEAQKKNMDFDFEEHQKM